MSHVSIAMTDLSAQPRTFAVFDGDLDADWAERYSHATALAVDTEAMGSVSYTHLTLPTIYSV